MALILVALNRSMKYVVFLVKKRFSCFFCLFVCSWIGFLLCLTNRIGINIFMKFMNIPQLVAVLHCAMKRSLVAETSD